MITKKYLLFLNRPALLCLALLFVPWFANSQSGAMEVGIDEKLGDMVSLDLTVYDHEGNAIRLADFVDRPTVLALVYYRCPDICSPLLMGLSDAIEKMTLEPGEAYKVLFSYPYIYVSVWICLFKGSRAVLS